MNMIIGKKGTKKIPGNICWIFYCQQGLHASHIKSVHLFMANANGKSFSCRKLAELTFFRAQKIHLSRVVSAVKDELRPPKEVIYWTPCYCCTNKVAQNGWKIHLNFAYPFTLAKKTFSYDFHTLWTPVPFCNFSTQSNFAKNVVGAASFFSIIPNCFQRQFYRQNWRFFEFDLPDNNRACFFRKKTCAMYAI